MKNQNDDLGSGCFFLMLMVTLVGFLFRYGWEICGEILDILAATGGAK